MEQAAPQPRPERPSPPAASLARCAPAFALVLETLLIGCRDCRPSAGGRVNRHRWERGRSTTDPHVECTGNHRRRAVPLRVDEKRRGVFRSTLTGAIHRSTHSTNAGGISFRTIMTRKIRSSRNSVETPTRAAAMVAYRAHASAMPLADPRLIVGISLNMSLGAKHASMCASRTRIRPADHVSGGNRFGFRPQ
jgi:hypothetical protein